MRMGILILVPLVAAILTLLAIGIVRGWAFAERLGAYIGRHTELPAAANRESVTASLTTIATYLFGIAISLTMGLAVFILVDFIFDMNWPDRHYTGMTLASFLVSLALGVLTGAWLFFPGRFRILPGQKGFYNILGLPLGWKIGVGDGWTPPLIGDVTIVSSAAKRVDPPEEEYVTADGFAVKADSSLFYEIVDPLASKNIEDGQTEDGFMQAEYLDAIRQYIINVPTDPDNVFKADMTLEDAKKLLKSITAFKADLLGNGKDTILHTVNEQAALYGLKATRVQIENVRLPQGVEDAASQILVEALQSASLEKDARNKKKVVSVLMETFTDAGINMETLDAKLKADLIDKAMDRAMAMEKQATVTRVNVSETGGGRRGGRSSTVVPIVGGGS
jgi:regulator of protease activity HflC (stomatin/prohibitin superfamily)